MDEERILAQAEEVLGLVEGLCRLLRARVGELAGEVGVSRAGLELLWVCAGEPEGLSVREAARVLGVRPQGLSTLAVQLERDGLLVRERRPGDRRVRRLVPSQAGREVLRRVAGRRRQWAQAVVRAVPQPAVARLVLGRLVEALGGRGG